MNMPGFSAEASLYKTKELYRANGVGSGAEGAVNAAGRGRRSRNGAGHSSPARRANGPAEPPRHFRRQPTPSGTARRAESPWLLQLEPESTSARPDPHRALTAGPAFSFVPTLESAVFAPKRVSRESVWPGKRSTERVKLHQHPAIQFGKQLAKTALLTILNFF